MIRGEKIIFRLKGASQCGAGVVWESERDGQVAVAVIHWAGEAGREYRPLAIFPAGELMRGEVTPNGKKGKDNPPRDKRHD